MEDVIANKVKFRLGKDPVRFLSGLVYAAVHAGKKDLVVKLQLVSFAFILLVCQNTSLECCLFECYAIGLKYSSHFFIQSDLKLS